MPGHPRTRRGVLAFLAFLAFFALLGCAAHRPRFADAPLSQRAGFDYEVVASPGGAELAVSAIFAGGSGAELGVPREAAPYIRDVEIDTGGRFQQLRTWNAPACAGGCRVRYRVALGEAARALHDVATARESGGAIEAPPSTWLLRPMQAPEGTPFRFHVHAAAGESFVAGMTKVGPDTYEGKTAAWMQLPYAAFGPLRVHAVHRGDVTLAILPGEVDDESALVAWAEDATRTVGSFFGRMPVKGTLVLVRPVRARDGRHGRHGVGFGTTMGNAGAAIAVDVGAAARRDDLADDWVLVHELVHTAVPDVDPEQHWLEEGLATYIEPIARARVGLTTENAVWRGWVRGMPHGLPADGDQGLDRTHTWGRTYWGGALFCLLADVGIRERTHGEKSLDDALRAVLAAGGSITVAWSIDRILDVGDAATGVPVIRELYRRMAHEPAPVDLDDLWRRLGVVAHGDAMAFDDTAPLASVRTAMTLSRPLPQ
jgi:hypothetical protein